MSNSIHPFSSPLEESEGSFNYNINLSYSHSIVNSNSKEKIESPSSQCSPLPVPYKETICCICGSGNLIFSCQKKGCSFKFHLHCLSYYFPELERSKKTCPNHSFKHLDECLKLVFFSDNFNHNPIIPPLIKSETPAITEKNLTGTLFWSAISQQYFPYFNIKKPNFSETSEEKLIKSDSWISQKISNISSKLDAVSQKTVSLINCLEHYSNNCSKNPKIGENLGNSSRLQLNLASKFIRKYEQSQKKLFKGAQGFFSSNPFTCEICNLPDSNKQNPILTCTNCYVQVHLLCYDTSQPFFKTWLCDPCNNDPTNVQSCCLCSNQRGALKFIKPGNWAHVTCARYLQKCFLKDDELDMAKIDKQKFKLKCFSCGIKTGACVQCCYGRCANAFHVECRKDLLEIESGQRFWLCPNHKAAKLTRKVKAKQDAQQEFVKRVASKFWNQMTGEQKQVKRKYTRVKKKKDQGKKGKFIIDISEEQVLLKVVVNKKVARTIKYSKTSPADKNQDLYRKDKSPKKEEGEVRKIPGIPIKKAAKDREDYSLFESEKSEFGVKLKIPKNYFQDYFANR